MISRDDIEAIDRAEVVDRDGERVGRVDEVYVSDDDAQPLFVTVRTGPLGTGRSFVPLLGAELADGVLRVAYDRATIVDAPDVVADGAITDDEQGTIFDYYDGRAGGAVSGTHEAPAGFTDEDTGQAGRTGEPTS